MTTTTKSRCQRATRSPRVIDTPFINLDELPDDRLSAARLYEIELYNHSFLAPSPEEARSLAALARAGDTQAREDMVVACLRYVFHVGHGLAHQHGIDFLAADVVPEGNLSVMEHLEKSYNHISPFGYLMTCAKFEMARWAPRHSTIIPVPSSEHPDREKRAQPYQIFSVDALVLQRDFTNAALATEQEVACDGSNRRRSCGVAGKRSKPTPQANQTPAGARRPAKASAPERR
jgi:hypothetical protein